MTERPRRPRGEGSIHKRPNGTWCGQVDLGWGPNGRRRKTVYGPTQNAVLRKLTDLRRQLAEAGDLSTEDMRVENWLRYWLKEIAADRVKPSTLRSYRTAVNEHLIPAIGSLRLGRLAVHHVTEMNHSLTARGLSSTTARNAHRVLSAALNDAVRHGKVGRNVAGIARAPSKAVSTRTGLSSEQAIAVMRKAAEGDADLWSRWVVAFVLGVRQGERLGLRWSQVDLERGAVDFAWSLQRVTWAHGCGQREPDHTARRCPKTRLAIPTGMQHEVLHGGLVLLRPKTTGSVRVLPLPPLVRAALKQRRATVNRERGGYVRDLDLVWCESNGLPIDPRRDWQAWTDSLDAAGVPHVTGHEARHTTATLLLDMGVPQDVIAQILGHSDMVTQRGYQHADLRRAMEALTGLESRYKLAVEGGGAAG